MTKSQKTRQFIIEQTAPIVNTKGVAGTAISDIMEATKLAKGGIYGNFDSKEEICLEAFQFLTAKVARGLDSVVADRSSAKEKLFALLDYYQNHLASDEAGGCPLLNFGTEADDTNPQLKILVGKAVTRSQQRIARIIQQGQTAGEFSKRLDADTFAIKMFAMIEGGIFSSRVTNNKGLMRTIVEILKKEISDL